MPYDIDADVYKPDSRGKPPTGLIGTVAEGLFTECKKLWRNAADLRKVFDVLVEEFGPDSDVKNIDAPLLIRWDMKGPRSKFTYEQMVAAMHDTFQGKLGPVKSIVFNIQNTSFNSAEFDLRQFLVDENAKRKDQPAQEQPEQQRQRTEEPQQQQEQAQTPAGLLGAIMGGASTPITPGTARRDDITQQLTFGRPMSASNLTFTPGTFNSAMFGSSNVRYTKFLATVPGIIKMFLPSTVLGTIHSKRLSGVMLSYFIPPGLRTTLSLAKAPKQSSIQIGSGTSLVVSQDAGRARKNVFTDVHMVQEALKILGKVLDLYGSTVPEQPNPNPGYEEGFAGLVTGFRQHVGLSSAAGGAMNPARQVMALLHLLQAVLNNTEELWTSCLKSFPSFVPCAQIFSSVLLSFSQGRGGGGGRGSFRQPAPTNRGTAGGGLPSTRKRASDFVAPADKSLNGTKLCFPHMCAGRCGCPDPKTPASHPKETEHAPLFARWQAARRQASNAGRGQ